MIKRIWYKLSAKYNIINVPPKQKEENKSEKFLYVRQSKGTWQNCGTCSHKSRDCKKWNKTSTIRTERNMDKSLNNISARISASKNARTVTIRVANKYSAGRNKGRRRKRKEKMVYEIVHGKIFFGDDALACKKKNQQRNRGKVRFWLRIYVTYGEHY